MAPPISYEEALSRAVADAGLGAFGCVFVEAWVMSPDNTALTRPRGGCWLDPIFLRSLPDERSEEEARGLRDEAEDCPPGCGLAGTLAEEGGMNFRDVHWRQILGMLNDPFVQRGARRRMERFFGLGIGLVAAVPFCLQDERGMVLYYSRSSADVGLLRAASNERCLLASADLIGATYMIRKARMESDELRKRRYRKSVRLVRRELLKERVCLFSVVMNKDFMGHLKTRRDMEASEMFTEKQSASQILIGRLVQQAQRISGIMSKRIVTSQKKWRGAKLHGPPRKSPSDCLFSFVGSFITMLALLKISESGEEGGRFDFNPGWYASTLCLVFALTPAPVGQPRQIFGAHLWNMLAGLLCRQIPVRAAGGLVRNGVPLAWVQALAVALGISGQSFTGIIHPPATGLCIAFASGPRWTCRTIANVMLADSVVVAISVIFINLSEEKQYPMFWLGLGWAGSDGTVGIVRGKSRKLAEIVRRKTVSFTDSFPLPKNEDGQSQGTLRRGPLNNASYGSINLPLGNPIV